MWCYFNTWFQRLCVWGPDGKKERIQDFGIVNENDKEFVGFWFRAYLDKRDRIEHLAEKAINFYFKRNKVVLRINVIPTWVDSQLNAQLHWESFGQGCSE